MNHTERRARVIAGAMWSADDQPEWEEFSASAQIEALAQARAIAASDAAAGYVLVPREATDDMVAAAFIAWAESMEGPIAQMLRIQNAVNAAIAAAKEMEG